MVVVRLYNTGADSLYMDCPSRLCLQFRPHSRYNAAEAQDQAHVHVHVHDPPLHSSGQGSRLDTRSAVFATASCWLLRMVVLPRKLYPKVGAVWGNNLFAAWSG